MESNYKLYIELDRLRDRIKDREKRLHGRAPAVCSDIALSEISELCPKKMSDFESVSGIGKSFIENYGKEFLEVILKHTEVQTEKKISINPSAAETLKELEKKLVSINKRNRLLYMPKLSNKYAFDMYEVGANCLSKLIYGKAQSITLANIDGVSGEAYQQEFLRFKRISQLLREINKDLRDKGQNDLYIGYPFVIGKIPGEDFDVRAPLALFPIEAEKTPTSIKISLDKSRDVIYNTTFILAFYKFNNINTPLTNDVIESVSEASFFDSLIQYYAEKQMLIKENSGELSKFREYKADEFPSFQNGELHLEKCAILGKFPICSSSIQKDFDEILKNNEINSLLNDLLLNSNEIDYYSDGVNEETKPKIDDKKLAVSEKKLVYINELNSSQEAVLSAIDKCNELVVQGPPGTGKSQVITSLISKFVSNEKTVLMVSEKKTALDVVYSRLGTLSQFALLIDDVGNKDAFYQQLSKMVNLGDVSLENVDLGLISEQIDALVKPLEAIANKLYVLDEFGVEPYKLYIQNKRYDLSINEQREKVSSIIQQRNANLLTIKYSELERIYQLFKDTTLCSNLDMYTKITNDYPWISKIREDLSELDIITLNNKFTQINASIEEWKGKNFFAKLFSKGKVTQEINQVLTEYFTVSSKDMEELIFEKSSSIIDSISHYISYQEVKPLYERLTAQERIYLHSLLNIKKTLNGDYAEINDELYNELIYEHIGRFEANNRALFQDIDNFDTIIRSLSESIAKKQKLSRQRLELLLAEEMYNITTSKRHSEILRVLESKRKWSVNKFINKFNFELFKSIKIWLLTPEVVSEIIPLQTGIFDLVVFDEASQMYVEKGIPSILRAKKVIIAGDHKQLRPSNLGAGRIEMDLDELPEDTELTAALEEESLLDLARFKYKDVLLNFHYRSKYEELIAFSNHAFYNGRLYVSPNANPPSVPPIEVHKMDNALWQNRTNVEEAQYIVNMLKVFFDERRENETVGIITFNSSQRDLIDDLIDEECAKNPHFAASIRTELARKKDGEDIGLFVKNIESVQGDERDVIIFSIGYAKNENGRLIRNFGWLNQKGGENRLNVAISRAKKKVHIVTSFDPSELQVDDAKNDGPRILKKYLEYAFAVSNSDKQAAKQILHSFGDSNTRKNVSSDSDFENQVYDALKAEGYEVDTQIGIGGYSIDLAIKKNGKYILGIECDGKLYHSSKSARERDYHRKKYLESRGWRIHRIWSTNWWKNPKQEINKIMTIVDSLS